MRTLSLVVVTVLFLASFSKASAIRPTAGLPLKLNEYLPKSKGISRSDHVSIMASSSQHRSLTLENDDEKDNREDNADVLARSGEKISEQSAPKSHEMKEIEYDKYSAEELEDIKRAMVDEQRERVLSIMKLKCNFQPLNEEKQEQISQIPDAFSLHLMETEAEQRNGLAVVRDVDSWLSRLPTGCSSLVNGYGVQDGVVCSGPGVEVIPEFRIRRVQELEFDHTAVQKVSQIDIDNLPRSITKLSFTNGILASFDGRNLKYIEGLETLSLNNNVLSRWSFGMVFKDDVSSNLTHTIKYMDLRNNYFVYPPDPAGPNPVVMPNLETIGMNNNPMGYLPQKLFQPLKNCPIKRLYMKNCSLCDFKGDPLQYMPQLEILDLSVNMGINPSRLNDFLTPLQNGSLRELILAQNNYASVPTDALAKVNRTLEILDLHASAFTCLDNTSFPFMPKLKKLNLMYSRIYSIQENAFEALPSLEELLLDGNFLQSFPPAILLPSLRKLSLTENPTYTGGDVPYRFNLENVNLTKMINLHSLVLDKVRLFEVKNTYFDGLFELRNLSLTECHLTNIQPFSFNNMAKLEQLHLGGNDLSLIANNTFSGLVNLTTLDLQKNVITFFSNIVIRPLYTGIIESETPSLLQDGSSGTMRNFRKMTTGREFPQALSKWLTSIQHRNDVAQGLLNTDDFGKEPISFFPFGGLGQLRVLKLSDNQIKRLLPEIFAELVNIEVLDLSHNQIKQWVDPIFKNCHRLRQLDLDSNTMTSLTDAMVEDFSLESLQSINLQNNDLVCNCSLMSFNDTLDTSLFSGYPDYVCMDGHKYYNVSLYLQSADCPILPSNQNGDDPPTFNIKYIVLCTVGVSIVFFFTSVLIYKKRWYIRYIGYSMKSGMWTNKEDEDHYLYDTFVCYSQSDRQWVFEHLLTKLEDVARYRVCVHERDFTVGQEITENIIYSVEKSRKVIVVLTPAFVASSWCMFELQMASNKILDEKKSKLILILLEPIPAKSQPKKLRLLLKTRTYIIWEETEDQQKFFWARLSRAITKPSDRDDTVASVSSLVESLPSSPSTSSLTLSSSSSSSSSPPSSSSSSSPPSSSSSCSSPTISFSSLTSKESWSNTK